MYGETINQIGYLYTFICKRFLFNFSSPPSNEHCSFWVDWEKEYIGVLGFFIVVEKVFPPFVGVTHSVTQQPPTLLVFELESKSAIWHFPQKKLSLVIQGKLEFAHFVQLSSWGAGRWGDLWLPINESWLNLKGNNWGGKERVNKFVVIILIRKEMKN